MSNAPSQVELQQSTGNLLGLPILIAVVVVALVVSEFAHGSASPTVLGICGGAALLDVVFARYVMRNMGSTLTVTPDEITFTRRHGLTATIRRSEGSTLSFRTGRNGPFGSEYTGYVLKLRDNATGQEVFAGAFGRPRVQRACESQGWTFG